MTEKPIKEKIAVLMGGASSERDISIKSGTAVHKALSSLELNVSCIDVSADPIKQIRQTKGEIAFIALHGKFGEDGTIQAMLEKENIPYTGSGPDASRLAMNKIASKKMFKDAGLPTPEFITLDKNGARHHFKKWCLAPFFPIVVKPNKEGSSIGMSVVRKKEDLQKAIDNAFLYDDDIIIEEFIDGDDITVGILEDKPLPVVRIKPKQGIYDFDAKYAKGMSKYEVPAKLKANVIKEAQDLGFKVHKLLSCRCFSRVDMRLSKDNKIKILELNTVPGLTTTSLLPKAANAAGINFAQMCLKMLRNYG